MLTKPLIEVNKILGDNTNKDWKVPVEVGMGTGINWLQAHEFFVIMEYLLVITQAKSKGYLRRFK